MDAVSLRFIYIFLCRSPAWLGYAFSRFFIGRFLGHCPCFIDSEVEPPFLIDFVFLWDFPAFFEATIRISRFHLVSGDSVFCFCFFFTGISLLSLKQPYAFRVFIGFSGIRVFFHWDFPAFIEATIRISRFHWFLGIPYFWSVPSEGT